MNRKGVVGGVVGGVAALGTAGAVAAAAQQRRSTQRLRARAEAAPAELGELPSDRSGVLAAADGVPLHYEEVGPLGAPLTVVFVHGYCLSLGEFHFQRLALTERFGPDVRLVFYDQRSHGRSGHSDPKHTTIDQLGRDLATVLAERVPDGPLVVVGHSMGGMTIMSLADQLPSLFGATGRVRGVALISTSSGQLSGLTLGLPAVFARVQTPVLGLLLRVARSQAGLIERGRRVGADIAWTITQRMSFGDPDIDPAVSKYLNGLIAATRVDVVADFFPSLVHHDKAGALEYLRHVDVEIICGDRDLLLPLAHSQAIAAALPDARLTVVAGAGHIVLMEQPKIVDDILAGLVERAETPVAEVG